MDPWWRQVSARQAGGSAHASVGGSVLASGGLLPLSPQAAVGSGPGAGGTGWCRRSPCRGPAGGRRRRGPPVAPQSATAALSALKRTVDAPQDGGLLGVEVFRGDPEPQLRGRRQGQRGPGPARPHAHAASSGPGAVSRRGGGSPGALLPLGCSFLRGVGGRRRSVPARFGGGLRGRPGPPRFREHQASAGAVGARDGVSPGGAGAQRVLGALRGAGPSLQRPRPGLGGRGACLDPRGPGCRRRSPGAVGAGRLLGGGGLFLLVRSPVFPRALGFGPRRAAAWGPPGCRARPEHACQLPCRTESDAAG